MDVSVFYGRRTCHARAVDRAVALPTGGIIMGGIGKTSLSVKLAEQIQGEFEYLIWRSLLHAPPIEDIWQNCSNSCLIRKLTSQNSRQSNIATDRVFTLLTLSACTG